ncbi:MAG: hypothetical protein RL136_389 [Planctomycetota bacterium]
MRVPCSSTVRAPATGREARCQIDAGGVRETRRQPRECERCVLPRPGGARIAGMCFRARVAGDARRAVTGPHQPSAHIHDSCRWIGRIPAASLREAGCGARCCSQSASRLRTDSGRLAARPRLRLHEPSIGGAGGSADGCVCLRPEWLSADAHGVEASPRLLTHTAVSGDGLADTGLPAHRGYAASMGRRSSARCTELPLHGHVRASLRTRRSLCPFAVAAVLRRIHRPRRRARDTSAVWTAPRTVPRRNGLERAGARRCEWSGAVRTAVASADTATDRHPIGREHAASSGERRMRWFHHRVPTRTSRIASKSVRPLRGLHRTRRPRRTEATVRRIHG